MKAANIRLIIFSAGTVAAHFALAFFTLRSQTVQLFGLFSLCFLFYFLLCQMDVTQRQLAWLLGCSVLLRLLWLFAFPQLSDDWVRFVWDGRLQASGYNPFNYLPSALMRGGLPGSEVADPNLFHALNSPDYFTVYPPMLQAMFAFAAWLFPHQVYANVLVLKIFIFFADCGSIILMLRLCSRWKIPRKKTMIYALNPLVIAELTGNVHHEGIVVFFLLSAFCLLQNGKLLAAALFFACAAATKLIPLLFLPLMISYLGLRRGIYFSAIALLFFAMSWLPFVNSGLIHHATASIGLYFNLFEFNAGIYYLVRDVVYQVTHEIKIEIIAPVLGMLSTAIMLGYAFSKYNKLSSQELPQAFLFTLSIYLAFTTMVHPWYIVPLIALSAFTRLSFPLVWSAIIVSSYYEYRTIPEVESNAQLWIEYGLVLTAVARDIHNMKKPRINLQG